MRSRAAFQTVVAWRVINASRKVWVVLARFKISCGNRNEKIWKNLRRQALEAFMKLELKCTAKRMSTGMLGKRLSLPCPLKIPWGRDWNAVEQLCSGSALVFAFLAGRPEVPCDWSIQFNDTDMEKTHCVFFLALRCYCHLHYCRQTRLWRHRQKTRLFLSPSALISTAPETFWRVLHVLSWWEEERKPVATTMGLNVDNRVVSH